MGLPFEGVEEGLVVVKSYILERASLSGRCTTTFIAPYVKPKFINPLLLEKHTLLEEVLQDEAVGMAFPVDQFPLVFEGIDIAGVQHPQPQVSKCRNTLQQLVTDFQPFGDRGATDLQALGDSQACCILLLLVLIWSHPVSWPYRTRIVPVSSTNLRTCMLTDTLELTGKLTG